MREDTNSTITKTTVHCATCDGRFGLIRHRFAHKQFCSKHCLNQYLANGKREPFGLKQWIDFSRG